MNAFVSDPQAVRAQSAANPGIEQGCGSARETRFKVGRLGDGNLSEETKSDQMGTSIVQSFKFVGSLMQKAGPYLLLEILLPGGTLFALLLFLYRRRTRPDAANASRLGVVIARAIGTVQEAIAFVGRLAGAASVWRNRQRGRRGGEALAIATPAHAGSGAGGSRLAMIHFLAYNVAL
jgi:hypothetical protein